MKTTKHTCPVCGKPIQDYHSQDIICPACNTDLSIYRTIDSIPEKTLWRGWLYVAIVALVATIATLTTLYVSSTAHKAQLKQLEAKNISLQTENSQLRDSLSSVQPEEKGQNIKAFPYIIRKGDCLWTISKRLYGTGAQVQQIAEDNGITHDTPLNIGDTLFIKY